MTIDFILSILGLGIAVGGLGLGAWYALKRWRIKNPIAFNGMVKLYVLSLVLLGVFSGYKFLTSSYYLTKQGVNYVVDKGQDFVSSAISFGMVTIIDGFGKTSEHYEQKWENKKLTESSKMEFAIISVKERKDKNKSIVHITFSAKNGSNKTISLNQMIRDELILLKDKNGLCFPLKLSDNRELTIAPHGSLVSEIDVVLPDGVLIEEFITPNSKLSLGR